MPIGYMWPIYSYIRPTGLEILQILFSKLIIDSHLEYLIQAYMTRVHTNVNVSLSYYFNKITVLPRSNDVRRPDQGSRSQS
jgi:hypothetical protein